MKVTPSLVHKSTRRHNLQPADTRLPLAYPRTRLISSFTNKQILRFSPKAIRAVRDRLVDMELAWHRRFQNDIDKIGLLTMDQFINQYGPEPREGFYSAALKHLDREPYELHPKLIALVKDENWLQPTGKRLKLPIAMMIRESAFFPTPTLIEDEKAIDKIYNRIARYLSKKLKSQLATIKDIFKDTKADNKVRRRVHIKRQKAMPNLLDPVRVPMKVKAESRLMRIG